MLRLAAGFLLFVSVTCQRPEFQVPGSCGQVWSASTYNGHWPDQDSLDMARWDSSWNNVCGGEAVRAAASGTVIFAQKMASSASCKDPENRIYIDHGNNWVSHYIHLQSPVNSALLNRQVAQGQIIGYTGKTGCTVDHIHFTQLLNGNAVRSEFGGALVDTRQADMSTWGHWGGSNQEMIRSINCAGEKFMVWSDGGATYNLIYNPGSGNVKMFRMHADGKGITITWTGKWSLQYTHMEAYRINGVNYAILYKAPNGHVQFIRMNANGAGYTNTRSGTWGVGWTNIVPFNVGNRAYLLVYNTVRGWANFERVNPGNDATTNIYKSTWSKRYTQLVPYAYGGGQYILLYTGGSGHVRVYQMNIWYSSLSLTYKSFAAWDGDYTHMVAFQTLFGESLLCIYKQETGATKFMKFTANGQDLVQTYSATWSRPWTHIQPFTITTGLFSQGGLLLYRAGTGYAYSMSMNWGGTGYTYLWSSWWQAGWN